MRTIRYHLEKSWKQAGFVCLFLSPFAQAAMPVDECNYTRECQNIYGSSAFDCVDSRSDHSYCMCDEGICADVQDHSGPETEPDPTPAPKPKPTPDSGKYFTNTVFDNNPEELTPAARFNNNTNDTQRVAQALARAAREDANGGVVILRRSNNSANNRYRLDRIDFPSNVRLEIDPAVTIEMIGNLKRGGKAPFLFTVGRSQSINNLMAKRIKNVEITSTHPTKRFTIDARRNMPIKYGWDNHKTVDTGANLTRAIPVGIFYAENFAVSNIRIIDNHTESVGVQMYPDTDYKDGAYVDRKGTNGDPSDDVYLDGPNGNPLLMDRNGNFINARGEIVADHKAIVRNPAYGRTPLKGTIENIRVENAHTGYGAVQAYAGDWLMIRNIEAVNGVGVRIEAGNGATTDNINRAGPYLGSINHVEVHDVTITNGFTGVWLKAHGKINNDILVNNVTAIDSGTAVIADKSHMNAQAREFINGRFTNTRITGDITLTRTKNKPLAEVGNVLTYFMSPTERDRLVDINGDGKISQADLPHNTSGHRWYLMQPSSPLIMSSQRSASRIGNRSSNPKTKEAGYYPIDFSKAKVKGNNLLRPEKILYNEDSRNLNGGPSNRL